MLPTLSRLSISTVPESRLRHRCSSRYLRISPLHREFHSPLRPSRTRVSNGRLRLSRSLSRRTSRPAYTRFTPSNSGQRLPPTYYRGCWHVVSRGFFLGYRPFSSPRKGLYIPKDFVTHAASLHQAFAHCAISLIAAPQRSQGRVSVPVWLTILSDQLPVVALVSRHLTN